MLFLHVTVRLFLGPSIPGRDVRVFARAGKQANRRVEFHVLSRESERALRAMVAPIHPWAYD